MLTRRVLRSVRACDALADDWQALCDELTSDAPFGQPAWLREALTDAAANESLRLVALFDDQRLVGLAPLQLGARGRGLLKRNVLQLLKPVALAGVDGRSMRSSLLCARGAEQEMVNALLELFDRELAEWDRLELSGMPSDEAMPALMLASARSLGATTLDMDEVEWRREARQGSPRRPDGWRQVDRSTALRRATSDKQRGEAASIFARTEYSSGGRPVAFSAAPDVADVWLLERDAQAVAAALTARGASGDRYLIACAAPRRAPADSRCAMTALLMEDTFEEGHNFRSWCSSDAGLFTDQCPLRTLTVERYNTRNTRNRLFQRLQRRLPRLGTRS